MNEWQAIRQIKYRLEQHAWSEGSAARVFGSNGVLVTAADISTELILRAPKPFIVLRPGSGQQDPEFTDNPGIVRLEVLARIYQSVAGGAVGQESLLGATVIDEGLSGGRGLLEVQEEFYSVIDILNRADALWVQARALSVTDATFGSDHGWLAYRDYSIEVKVGTARTYPPPRSLVATDGVGQISLAWKNPSTRFDLYRMILRRASGSTPPATHTAGSDVPLAGLLSTSKVDVVSPGTYSYALFASYDARGVPPATDRHVSASETRTAAST